jgi:hypothetical protein
VSFTTLLAVVLNSSRFSKEADMTERSPSNTDEASQDVVQFHDQCPSPFAPWTVPARSGRSRACGLAASVYGSGRASDAFPDVAAGAGLKSIAGEPRASEDDRDLERARELVDIGNGAPPRRARGPANEMDKALGALASQRDAALTNADTYVVVLCVLAFASLALLGFLPLHSDRTDVAPAAATQSIACERLDEPLPTARPAHFSLPCR